MQIRRDNTDDLRKAMDELCAWLLANKQEAFASRLTDYVTTMENGFNALVVDNEWYQKAYEEVSKALEQERL